VYDTHGVLSNVDFIETVAKMADILYTQQVNTLANGFSADVGKPFAIILANIAVLAVLFTVAFKKRREM